MALVLFVLLAAYFLIRVGSDKAAHREAEKEFESVKLEDDCAKSDWERRATNKELESELEEKIYSRDEDVLEELKSIWNVYYNVEFPSIVHNDKKNMRFLYDGIGNEITDYNCLRILMCNRGFLTWYDAVHGIPIVKCGNTTKRAQLCYENMIRFVKRMDEGLRKRNIHESVYLELTDGTIYSLDEQSSHIGAIKWRPAISTFKIRLSNTNRGTDYQ